MRRYGIDIPQAEIAGFCRRWRILELSLFGSVVRADFGPDSDIDVLLTFESQVTWSLLDLVQMREELESLFERAVDLVEEAALRNPVRRRAILREKEVIYAA
jgi:hypothetical protein